VKRTAAYVVASAEHSTVWHVSRKTGTGTIEVSLDDGATWTDITSSIGTDYAGIVVSQTVTNPQIGIRIVTSGDAVYVGNAELYASTSEAVAVGLAKFPIFTSGSSVTRDVCDIGADKANHSDTQGLYYCEYKMPVALGDLPVSTNYGLFGISSAKYNIMYLQNNSSADPRVMTYDGTSSRIVNEVGEGVTWEANEAHKAGLVYGGSEYGLRDAEGPIEEGSYDGGFVSTGSYLYLGGQTNSEAVRYIRNMRRYDVDYETGKAILAKLVS
jgi:hypothetical protein